MPCNHSPRMPAPAQSPLGESSTLSSAEARGAQLGGAIYSIFLLAIFVGIVGAGVVAFIELTDTNPLSPVFLEETPPELTWHEEPRGLGAEAAILGLTVSDAGSGLDEIVVRISQKNRPTELVRKKFDITRVTEETVEFAVNPKELNLREGNAEIQVLAFDKSLWNNGARLSKTVEINFLKPQITVLTPQQNGVLGGSELVFYKVQGKIPDSHGVLSQGSLYPGFPADGWDEAFKGRSGVYIAFYPIPATFKENSDKMQIVARDNLGNSAIAPFNYRVRNRSWATFRMNLGEDQALRLKEALSGYAQRENVTARSTGTLAGDLRTLIRTLATNDEGFIGTTLSQSEPIRLWSGAFSLPVSSSPNNSMGDIRTVQVGSQEILRGPSAGVRFPVSRRTPIVASNRGRVVYVGELGLLGKTIIIDHGFGLATIYGHLSEIKVERGSILDRDQPIAHTGTSGFAQSEEVYFEARMHGVPVSPNEWWDETWVTDHIENKVAFVKRDLP